MFVSEIILRVEQLAAIVQESSLFSSIYGLIVMLVALKQMLDQK